MLRQMVFKNFINFKDFQSLEFKDGPHFFIGANSSGKSSTLEILRRCMSTDINTSISSSYDETRNAYAFCKFDLPSVTDISNFKNINKIYSGVIKTHENKFIKIVCLEQRESKSIVMHVIYYLQDGNNLTMVDKKTLNAETSKELSNMLMNLLSAKTELEQTTLEQNFLEYVVESRENLSSITDEEIQRYWATEGRTAEDFLSNLSTNQFIRDLESTYVATMPMRAIGTLQWTRSKKITLKEENYLEACKRAEIINELLTSDEVDHVKADSILKFFTHPFEYKFTSKSNPDEINVKETNSSEFHLLKTPEGIIEAKQFSLIMAHTVFHTICLEEPDRCMHPQMVERMRDIFQSESIHRNKVVVVISHNPFLINNITAENTHVFFRKSTQNSSKVRFGIWPIDKINRHITDVDNLKKLFFAVKVLCMEGSTDKIVIEGLFDFVLKYSDYKLDMKHDIVSHQLVVLGSHTFDSPVRQFCKQTSVSCKWVFDRDKYIFLDQTNNQKVVNIDRQRYADGDYSKFHNRHVTDFLEDPNGLNKLSEQLSDKQIFIWKLGDLEDTIIDSLRTIAPSDQSDIFDESRQKLTKKKIKKKLSSLPRDKLAKLSRIMFNSPEVKRFLTFLTESH
ncbi:uncharacterized protein LOC127706724 [Mytilus californianus]|uniref:uncharacterized protein LOC127706724 n=1 Tax=Mytilus californianus TaxID=6549 RepID=UPI002246E170|nr:uncharacterized protein LOC127706724 [Mytilus californianus]